MYKLAEDILSTYPLDYTKTFFRNVKDNANYGEYLLRHKYNVAKAGIKLNLPAMTIIKHDWSKFKPALWSAYKDYFYGPTGISGTNERDTYLKFRERVSDHYALEAHHSDKIGIPKDLATELESVADWYSVGRSRAAMQGQSFPSFKVWWLQGRARFAHQLMPETVAKVNELVSQNIDIFTYLFGDLI